MKKFLQLLVVFMSLNIFFASTGAAATATLDPALQATNKEKFDDQAAAIRIQMQPGGYWEFVDKTARRTIDRRLDEIASLLKDVDSADGLRNEQKEALMMAQEEVNAILTKSDGRRLVCRVAAPTGSHLKKQECQTLGQIERNRQEAQRFLTRDRPAQLERGH